MGNKMTLLIATAIGDLSLEIEGQSLMSLTINEKKAANKDAITLSSEKTGSLADILPTQINKYFTSASDFKNIQLTPQGTEFQKSVWKELSRIPVGETRTYGDIAKKLNSSARAVGNACRRNPIAIIVPCHRVISATGLGGYAGETQGQKLDTKRWLLKHEGAIE